MGFQNLFVAELGGTAPNFGYPAVDIGGKFYIEPQDGALVPLFRAQLAYGYSPDGNDWKDLIPDDDEVMMNVYMSDSRICLYAEEFGVVGITFGSKVAISAASEILGGGGTFYTTMANNSKKKQQRKANKGKALIGHIRYEWIDSIAVRMQGNLILDQELHLTYKDADGIEWIINLFLDDKYDVDIAVHYILQKMACYRLAMDDGKDESIQAFWKYYAAGGRMQIPNPKKITTLALPAALLAPFGEERRPAFAGVVATATQTQIPVPQQTPHPKFCVVCGTPLTVNAKFCTKCGTKIDTAL